MPVHFLLPLATPAPPTGLPPLHNVILADDLQKISHHLTVPQNIFDYTTLPYPTLNITGLRPYSVVVGALFVTTIFVTFVKK